MQYIWDSFNIKTFPANTFVFVDGDLKTDLSDFDSRLFDIKTSKNTGIINILKPGKLPVHIIYMGRISGEKVLEINILGENINVKFTGKISTSGPAKLKKTIKNAGKNSKFDGNLLVQNKSDFDLDVLGEHHASDTFIHSKTKIVAHRASDTNLVGTAIIGRGFENCDSDIGFSALCDPNIKSISFRPIQYISSEPQNADHSASIWRGGPHQIEYLRAAGLSAPEIDNILREAFEESD